MSYTIGERIKEKRLELGLSQQQLGDLFTPSVKRASVSRWESDISNPEIDKLPILAKKFKTTIDWLIVGDKSKNSSTKLVRSKALEDLIETLEILEKNNKLTFDEIIVLKTTAEMFGKSKGLNHSEIEAQKTA